MQSNEALQTSSSVHRLEFAALLRGKREVERCLLRLRPTRDVCIRCKTRSRLPGLLVHACVDLGAAIEEQTAAPMVGGKALPS